MRVRRKQKELTQGQEIALAIDNDLLAEDERPVEFMSTGTSNLNCAASARALDGGWARARVVNVVGDGSSGKTLLMLEVAAWVYYNIFNIQSEIFPIVKKLTIVYANIENVMDFPIKRMYGKKFVEFIEWVRFDNVEEFGADFFKRVKDTKKGHCVIYIVDSWDALDSEEDAKKFDEHLDKRIAGKSTEKDKGSYELGKQAYASKRFFKKVCRSIQEKDITLFIVSQTRTKIGVTFGKKKYRAGGNALDFYTHQVCWLAEVEKLKKQILGHKRVYGVRVRGRFERNKTATPFREAEFKIIFDYGVDDIGSMIDWLYGPKDKKITFMKKEFADKEEFIDYVEENDYIGKLQVMTQEKWNKIEDKLATKRKRRFIEE